MKSTQSESRMKNKFYECREQFGTGDDQKRAALNLVKNCEDAGLAAWMSRNREGWFVEFESKQENQHRLLEAS